MSCHPNNPGPRRTPPTDTAFVELRRRRKGLRGFTLLELMMVVIILGVLTTVAIPAFIRFMRRARSAEAIDHIDKIYKGAAAYFVTTQRSHQGLVVPCQFPEDQDVTPVEATCCSSNSQGGPDTDFDDRCDANPNTWLDPTWADLSFQVDDQHYYTYAFDSTGTTTTARFTASAYGDLDCDAVMSTFQRMGFANSAATASECGMRGSAAYYVEQETE